MRLRLFLSFLFVVIITTGSVVFFTTQGAAREFRIFVARGGLLGGEVLIEQLERYYDRDKSWQGADRIIRSYLAIPTFNQQGRRMNNPMQRQRLILADTSGKIIFDSQPTNIPETILSEEALSSAFELVSQQERKVVGYLYAVGSQQINSEIQQSLLVRINRAAWFASGLAAAFSLLLAMALAYFISGPIKTLTAATARMAEGDLSQRVLVQGSDEIASLGTAFNHMAASLEKAEHNRKAMTADITHELRTPLSVQRATIEALIDGIYPVSNEALVPILTQNQLLEKLVEDLRMLALADAGQLKIELSEIQLSSLIRQVLSNFEPQAALQSITLTFSEQDKCPPMALDARRIEQILTNLLSNALRYTPSGGKIMVHLGLIKDEAVITIHDSGPGIPNEALPYIFDRFYRADKGRSREEGGIGLGLAIARRYAQAHGGTIEASNHPEGGAVFSLKLPGTRTNASRS